MVNLPVATDRMLADVVRDHKLVEEPILKQAQKDAEVSGSGITAYLLGKELITEDQIAEAIGEMFGLPKVHVTEEQIKNRPAQEKVSLDFITRNRIIPFSEAGKDLLVAITDQAGLQQVNAMRMMTGKNIKTHVTTLSVLDKLLSSQAAAVSAAGGSSSSSVPAKAVVAKEKDAAKGSDVIAFVDSIFVDAISMGVSDIHVECFRESARVRFRKDGVLQTIEDYSEFLNYNYSAIVTRLKILASLDISERRLPQDGAIANDLGDKTVDVRVSILPTAHGERVVMRILDPDSANFTLDELGLPDYVMRKVRRAIHAPQGMVLVTGPTGSGKSTTLYAVLKELNKPEKNILTAEDPVEYDLEGVGQVHVRDDIGLTFEAALRSFLRQDPEVIMVGEIRDKATGDIAIKAALTGHLVLSTLHTNDAPSTVTRIINMGVPSYLITASLSLVIAQRLARKNCPDCKVIDEAVTPDDLVGIGFDEVEAGMLKCYKGSGCDSCLGTGIKGRRAIHEVLAMTQELREVVLAGGSDLDIRKQALEEGFETMQETGKNLIREGIITVNEFKRILVLD